MFVLDGAAIFNMLKPVRSYSFAECVNEFMAYIRSQFVKSVQPVHVVFNEYRDASLKAAIRMKKGTGVRIRVEGRKLPGNWHQFLREDGNKTEVSNVLSDNVTAETFPGVVVMTRGKEIRCSEVINEQELFPCTYEEPDTRKLLHAADGARQKCKRILVRTVDTDVVVLVVSTVNNLTCEQFLCHLGKEKHSATLMRLTWRESWVMTSATHYPLFMHSPGAKLRQVLQEEESVQHGQCGISSMMLRPLYIHLPKH